MPCKTDCLKFVTGKDSVSEISALITKQNKSSNLYVPWTLLENPEDLSYF